MPFASNADVRLYYEGVGSGETLLLLTGLGGTVDSWTRQRPGFEASYAVVAHDPRGSGRSTVPTRPYTTTDMAQDALAVLDECRVDAAHVLGVGLGGLVAQRLAIAWPERVRSLTLISSFARADAHARRLFETWAQMLPKLGWELLGRSISLWTLTPRFFEERADELREIESAFRHNVQPPEAYAGQVEALLSHDTEPDLHRIKAPTLVVLGEGDIETPARFADVLVVGIPGAELVVLPETGHRPHVETPAQFHAAVLAFLDRHSPITDDNAGGWDP